MVMYQTMIIDITMFSPKTTGSMAFYKHRVGIDKDQPLFLNSCSNRKESEDFEEQKHGNGYYAEAIL